MPCIDCGNGIEICGPDASQRDCDDFEQVATSDDDDNCPEHWCFERKCVEDGKSYSIWRPTSGKCLKHAYTPYKEGDDDCECDD